MADPKPKMIKATVAAGRTVKSGGTLITDKDGHVIGAVAGKDFGPGQEVELPEAEHDDLVAHGFLVDPGADAPYIATGPKIQVIGA